MRLFVNIFILMIAFSFTNAAYASDAPPSVFIEEMTWMEIRDAIASGKTTAIIPIGGTEQNGPHMVLGKHNIIVHYTARQIAKKLGNALVAPVMAYVPEGNITPPEAHMRYSGTLSLSDDTFKGVLRDTASSLKQHGFKRICFIGDHGGYQKLLEDVAGELSDEWKSGGVHVIHVSDYYSQKNGQDAWLSKYYTQEEIKGHAALADTSELSNIDQSAIRTKLIPTKAENGSTGSADNALPHVGMRLLNMKIDAAVKQIEAESK